MDFLESKLRKIFAFVEGRPVFFCVCLFSVTLAIRYCGAFLFWHIMKFPYQRDDPYLYVVKGMEIARGDWTPMTTHSVGWPAALGALFSFAGGSSATENLVSASMLAAFFSALSLLPFLYVARRFSSDPRALTIAGAFFALSFNFTMPENDSIAMSEPLFQFLFLSAMALLYASRERKPLMLASAFCAGLAYWTRPIGLFILPVIVISYFLWNRARRGTAPMILAAIAVFWITSAPFLFARHAAFGSAFSYGENDHYFSDTYTDAWGDAMSHPSLAEYLRTRPAKAIFDKFFLGGFGLVVMGLVTTSMFYAPPAGYYLIHEAGAAAIPAVAAIAIWIIGLIPVFHIFYNPRHVLPLMPFVLMMGAAGFAGMIRAARRSAAFSTLVILCSATIFAGYWSINVFIEKEQPITLHDGEKWAAYLAPRLKGTVAMGHGSDIFMSFFPDARAGGNGLMSMTAPQSERKIAYPGKVANLDELRPWLKKRDIDYVILDSVKRRGFAFAPEKYLSIYTGTSFPAYLKEVYSNYETDSQWKVRAFKVDKKRL